MQPAVNLASKPVPKPVNYGRTGPGSRVQALGDKMRQETSMALEQGLKHGSFQTGLETLVSKVAGSMPVAEHMAAQGHPAPATAPMAAPPAANPAAAQGRWGWGKKTLALGGLGVAGGMAMGMGAQHQNDEQKYPLVYAPMGQGSFY